MAWNDELEDGSPAHGIAASTSNRLLLLAGPGTGKSFAMKRRVARILEEDGVAPASILAVTFTRVAAEDLHRELVSLGVAGAEQLTGRTLHSLAMAILMKNHVLAVLGRVPRPLNEYELEPLLEDLNKLHGDKHARRRLIKAYGAAWARLQTEEPGFARTSEDQAFVDDLLAWLRFHNAMLIDELVPYLYQYLHSHPGAPEVTAYEHVLVDEYQDLNRAEQEVVRLLSENCSLCVIGDGDQSIYSFKHAHPDGIREWAARDTTDRRDIAECRRCPTTIVRMANTLIARNTLRIAARAMVERAENGAGEVQVRQYPTAEAEADAVAAKIHSLIADGVAPGEIIVLAQRKTFATPVFIRLHEGGIPVKSYYAESELDTLDAQERFAVLKLLLDGEDRVALRWLLGRGRPDWHRRAYARLMAHVGAHGGSPWSVLESVANGTAQISHVRTLVERFNEIRAELDSLRQETALDQFVQLWLPASDTTTLLSETVASVVDGCATQQELFDALYEAMTRPETPLEVSEVRVMSLHKSKGLSSPFVFIVGCVEGLLPGRPDPNLTPAGQLAKLEEDRRLLYVGITRVKASLPERAGYLALTYPQTMLNADAYTSQITPVRTVRGIAHLQPSRFLTEMLPHIPHATYNAHL